MRRGAGRHRRRRERASVGGGGDQRGGGGQERLRAGDGALGRRDQREDRGVIGPGDGHRRPRRGTPDRPAGRGRRRGGGPARTVAGRGWREPDQPQRGGGALERGKMPYLHLCRRHASHEQFGDGTLERGGEANEPRPMRQHDFAQFEARDVRLADRIAIVAGARGQGVLRQAERAAPLLNDAAERKGRRIHGRAILGWSDAGPAAGP